MRRSAGESAPRPDDGRYGCRDLASLLFWDEGVPSDAFEILGSPTHGTHAEYVVVPAEIVVPRPPHLSPVEAAALPMAGVTAWRALCTRGRLRSHETVIIGGKVLLSMPGAAATSDDLHTIDAPRSRV